MKKCESKARIFEETLAFEAMKERNLIEYQYIVSDKVKKALFAEKEQDDEIDPYCVLNQSESIFKQLMYQSIFKLYAREYPECINDDHEILSSGEIRAIIEGNMLSNNIIAGTALKNIYFVRQRLMQDMSQKIGAINDDEWLSKKAYSHFIQTIKGDVLDKNFMNDLVEELYYYVITQAASHVPVQHLVQFLIDMKAEFEKFRDIIVLRYLYEIPWYDTQDEEVILKLIDAGSVITKTYEDNETISFAHYADIKYLSRILVNNAAQVSLMIKMTKECLYRQYAVEFNDNMIEYYGYQQFMKVFSDIEEKYHWYFSKITLEEKPQAEEELSEPTIEKEIETVVKEEERHLDELVAEYHHQVKELIELQATNEPYENKEEHDHFIFQEESNRIPIEDISEEELFEIQKIMKTDFDENEDGDSRIDKIAVEEELSMDNEIEMAEELDKDMYAEEDVLYEQEMQSPEGELEEILSMGEQEKVFQNDEQPQAGVWNEYEQIEDIVFEGEADDEFERALASISSMPLEEDQEEKDLFDELGWEDAESDEFTWNDDENFLMESLKFDEDEFDFGEDEFDLEYELDMEKLIRGNE